MSWLASTAWNANRRAAANMPFPAISEENLMRAKLVAIRDTVIVLALQLVFRTTRLMRNLNY
jgi:hypothetical protein